MNTDYFFIKHLLKYKGKTVGVELKNISNNEIIIIPNKRFVELKGKLKNAEVLNNGVIRGINTHLEVKNITNEEMIELTRLFGIKQQLRSNEIKKYIIMWEDTEVLYFNKENGKIKIINADFLPYSLRNIKKLNGYKVLEWLKDRVTNIHRTYMNLIYIARQVGRDVDKVIADSAGLAITDHFWIKTTDTKVLKWDDLLKLKDKNEELNRIAVNGILKGGKELRKDYTTLFTLKGYYPKYSYDGNLYKRKEDAIREYPAYLLAKQLNLPIAECKIQGKLVKIELFVDNNVSLVHASELATYYECNVSSLNSIFAQLGRTDLMNQIDWLFIFNYLIGNVDLHSENFGFLFDNKTFKILSIAPFYDHNMSFRVNFDGELDDIGVNIEEWSKYTIAQYPQLCNALHKLNLNVVKPYIKKDEYAALIKRYNKLREWSKGIK